MAVHPREDAPDRGRRRWLFGAVTGSSLFVAGGVVAWLRSGGYQVASWEAADLRTLGTAEYVLVRALARRLLAPDEPGAPDPDEVGVARFVDRYAQGLRPRLLRDFRRMLRFTEQLAPLSCGYLGRFTSLAPHEQEQVLAALESSSVDQLRAGFQALKTVVMMGYYRDPRTFALLQYGGPLIAPPQRVPL